MRCRALWISLLAACAALPPVACATEARTRPHRGIAALWRDFQDMPPQRALALAGDPDKNWVAASSGGHASRREAEETVLATCRRRRVARRMQAPCRLYASGDEIVW